MAFRGLTTRLANALSLRSTKTTTAASIRTPSHSSDGSSDEQQPATTPQVVPPLTPTSASKGPGEDVFVQIKREHNDDDDVDEPRSAKRPRRYLAQTEGDDADTELDDDEAADSGEEEEEEEEEIEVPSIERTPSPENQVVLPSIERSPTPDEQGLRKNPGSPFECCDWDVPPGVLEEYETAKTGVKGSNTWTSTEATLHRLLGLRGYHALMPGTWKWDFSGLLMEEILFAPVYSKQKVALQCYTEGLSGGFHATKALGRIFSLPAHVSDLRKADMHHKSAMLIEREIRRYVQWAAKDAGLDKLSHASNIGVYRFDDDDDDDVNDNDNHSGMAAEEGGDGGGGLDRLLSKWATDYRQWYLDAGIRHPPSTLFALVIMQHLVLVLTVDAKRPLSPAKCFAELDMSLSDGRWLDHALNLAIPIHLARAGMVRLKDQLSPLMDVDDGDPDL